MTRLSWGDIGARLFEAGVDRGVFYPTVGPGVPWNGLLAVKESNDDNAQSIIYVDGLSYVTQVSLGTFSAELSAITYPLEFEEYDGYVDGLSNQLRKSFNLCYRSIVGNDVDDTSFGYKIHLVYNVLAEPTDTAFSSLDATVEATPFMWALSTTPVVITGYRPTSHLVIDTTRAYPSSISALEDILYGTVSEVPRMPSMEEVLALFEEHAIFRVTDNLDGTGTVTGPDEAVTDIGGDLYRLTWPSVVQIDDDVYRLSSL